MGILFIWVPLCIAVGILASRYHRSGIGWFFFSLLLSPLLGFAFVLACGPRTASSTEPVPARSGSKPHDASKHLTGGQRLSGNAAFVVFVVVFIGLIAWASRSTPTPSPAAVVKPAPTTVVAPFEKVATARVDADKIITEAKRAEADRKQPKRGIEPVTKFNTALGKYVTCANPKDHGTCTVAGDTRPPAPVPFGKRVVCDDPWQFKNCRLVAKN